MKPINWKLMGLLGAVLFVGLVVVFMATQNQDTEEIGKIPAEKRSLAHQLAISNAGKYVPENHETVTKFAELLNSLDKETFSTEKEIGDTSIESVDELDENYDVEVSLLEFMNRANKMVDGVGQKISYDEIAAKVKVILSQKKTEA